jgi:excisionase family DNA binding protein
MSIGLSREINRIPDLNEFMTTKEAAEKLGFHVKRIPTMVRNKSIEGIRFGRTWFVSRKSVQDYIE